MATGLGIGVGVGLEGQEGAAVAAGAHVDNLLLEDGSNLLLEDGSVLLLE